MYGRKSEIWCFLSGSCGFSKEYSLICDNICGCGTGTEDIILCSLHCDCTGQMTVSGKLQDENEYSFT